MKKLTVFAAFLMLTAISNNVSAQTTTEVEATIISISSDKTTGLAYSPETGNVIEFVNEILVDVLPSDKVLIAPITSGNERTGRITFKAKEGATYTTLEGDTRQISTAEGPRY